MRKLDQFTETILEKKNEEDKTQFKTHFRY